MKQTAVEWLIDEIEKHYIINNGSLNPTVVMELKRQAKEMEKELLEKAIRYGYELRNNHKPINSGIDWVKEFNSLNKQD